MRLQLSGLLLPLAIRQARRRLIHLRKPRAQQELQTIAFAGSTGDGTLVAADSEVPENHGRVLAPDIQEALLFLPRVTSGCAPIHETMLRPIAAESCWGKQRTLWAELMDR